MAEPSRIRVLAQPNGALVRVLMSHDMETGLRKDAEGHAVPAWYITQVGVALNGTQVLGAQWGTAIARNPFVEFFIEGAKPGDRVAIRWVDNRGEERNDEVGIA